MKQSIVKFFKSYLLVVWYGGVAQSGVNSLFSSSEEFKYWVRDMTMSLQSALVYFLDHFCVFWSVKILRNLVKYLSQMLLHLFGMSHLFGQYKVLPTPIIKLPEKKHIPGKNKLTSKSWESFLRMSKRLGLKLSSVIYVVFSVEFELIANLWNNRAYKIQ